jgi:hypothetical protein
LRIDPARVAFREQPLQALVSEPFDHRNNCKPSPIGCHQELARCGSAAGDSGRSPCHSTHFGSAVDRTIRGPAKQARMGTLQAIADRP